MSQQHVSYCDIPDRFDCFSIENWGLQRIEMFVIIKTNNKSQTTSFFSRTEKICSIHPLPIHSF